MNRSWYIAYAVGILAIVTSCAFGAASLILIGRAALSLRAGVGSSYSYGTLLVLGARVIVSRRALLSTVGSADIEHFQTFRRRMRYALSLLVVPFAIAALLRIYLFVAA